MSHLCPVEINIFANKFVPLHCHYIRTHARLTYCKKLFVTSKLILSYEYYIDHTILPVSQASFCMHQLMHSCTFLRRCESIDDARSFHMLPRNHSEGAPNDLTLQSRSRSAFRRSVLYASPPCGIINRNIFKSLRVNIYYVLSQRFSPEKSCYNLSINFFLLSDNCNFFTR